MHGLMILSNENVALEHIMIKHCNFWITHLRTQKRRAMYFCHYFKKLGEMQLHAREALMELLLKYPLQ